MPSLMIRDTAVGVVNTLGPGERSVVWVQGCAIHCPGCIVPESWGQSVGSHVDVDELAETLLGEHPDAGLTVSGGEPTEQAAAVAHLLESARRMGRTTWVYTGRRLEDLVAEADSSVLRMLALTDVLVDGPFEQGLAGSLPYRGSANQRILRLTEAIPQADCDADGIGGRVEVTLDSEGHLRIIGVPPPGFLNRMRESLARRGILVDPKDAWL